MCYSVGTFILRGDACVVPALRCAAPAASTLSYVGSHDEPPQINGIWAVPADVRRLLFGRSDRRRGMGRGMNLLLARCVAQAFDEHHCHPAVVVEAEAGRGHGLA
jgi:hypothetical protein